MDAGSLVSESPQSSVDRFGYGEDVWLGLSLTTAHPGDDSSAGSQPGASRLRRGRAGRADHGRQRMNVGSSG